MTPTVTNRSNTTHLKKNYSEDVYVGLKYQSLYCSRLRDILLCVPCNHFFQQKYLCNNSLKSLKKNNLLVERKN